MPTRDEIDQQVELLLVYRNNLAQYLYQQAQIGSAYVSPNVVNGIQEARNNIRRIKTILRQWSVPVKNHPDDEGATALQGSDEALEITIVTERIISRFTEEQLHLLSEATVQSLRSLSYDDTVIEDFRFVFHELTQNALEHGCRSNSDSFKVICVVARSCVTITVQNPPGRQFNVNAIITDNQIKFSENPQARRGRGLLLVSEVADTIAGSEEHEGIKAILYKERVLLDVERQEPIITIIVKSGLYNPSLKRRLLTEASKYLQFHLLIDFSQWHSLHTISQQAILEIAELYARTQRRIVALLPRSRNVILPYSSIAYSCEEAVNKILFGSRPTCRTCGYAPPYTARFCAQCGTMLPVTS